MIICHQCGHRIEVYSNITNIRCPKCRATYVSQPLKAVVQPVVEQAKKTFDSEHTIIKNFSGEDKTQIQTNPSHTGFKEPEIKVGLRFWGTFEVAFLEQIKSFSVPDSYKQEVIKRANQTISKLPVFYIPKNKVLIGRRPTNIAGFEDVDIKLESKDTTISRRQCEIEILPANDKVIVNLQTHVNASNLVEVNGKTIEKNTKKSILNGDFLRFGNTIFEVIIDKKNAEPVDFNKTVIY